MIKGVVSKVQDGQVSIRLADGQELYLPESELGEVKTGAEILLAVSISGSEKGPEAKLAKAIMNELIGGQEISN